MKRFENKAALVTAAAAGIGRSVARRLAQEGADLMLADINFPEVKSLAEALAEQYGVKVFAHHFDAAESESCKGLVSQSLAVLGKLDIVCNIAGIQKWDHFTQVADETWERLLAINLSSVFYISRESIASLEETGGNIVNIASTAGLTGIPYTAVYCASKSAVIGLTKSIAVEYAARGVRCNAIAPGGVKAGQAANPMPEGLDQQLLMGLSPKTGDMCEPEDIATAVAYLASDDASYITGTVLTVDGGQLAG